MVEHARVGGRVRARRAPDRRLVDVDDLVDSCRCPSPCGACPGAASPGAAGWRPRGTGSRSRAWTCPSPTRPSRRRRRRAGTRRRSPSGCAARRRGSRSPPLRLAPLRRHRDLPLAGQVLAGERLRHPLHLRRACPAATIWPPCSPAPGPRSTMWSAARIVPSSCSTTITVLPRSRSRVEHVEQLVVVALVQPDRGLVEDVEHAHEARADLRREPDPLRLAARQRGRRPLQRQVPDADARRGTAAARRSPSGSARRSAAPRPLSSRSSSHSIASRADLRVNSWMPRPPTLTARRLRPQPRAVALRAGPHRHVLLDALARVLGVGLEIAALEARDDALERRHVRAPAAHPVAVGDVHALALVAVQEQVLVLLRQVLPRHVEVDLVLLADRLCELLVVVGARAPGQDRALVDRQRSDRRPGRGRSPSASRGRCSAGTRRAVS